MVRQNLKTGFWKTIGWNTQENLKCMYNIAMIRIYTDMWNIYRMFTHIGIPKHKNTYDFLVHVRNFLLPLSLKVFRHKERDTIFLCWLFHQPQTTRDTCRKATGLASANPECQPSSSEPGTQQTLFSQISAHASGAWRQSHPWSHPLSAILIVTSLNDTSAPRARVNTCGHVCT